MMVKVRRSLCGERFGRLTVLWQTDDYISPQGIHAAKWYCKCDCGNYCSVAGRELKNGDTKSCGCLKRGKNPKISEAKKTHGMSKTRIYYIWRSMKTRCNNPNDTAYHNYGARGIRVCDKWNNSFEEFHSWAINNGYDKLYTLERIDVNDNYYPENCKWVTMKEQQNNRRNNATYTVNGETKTLSQWAECVGMSRSALWNRIHKSGLTIEQAISFPKLKKGTRIDRIIREN